MVINTAPTVIKQVTVGAIHFGTKPMPSCVLDNIAQACVNLYGENWKDRLVEAKVGDRS